MATKKILLIDGIQSEKDAIREIFRGIYDVYVAEKKEECVKFWLEYHKDICAIIVDAGKLVDRKSGFHRGDYRMFSRTVPIFAITDYGDIETSEEMVRVGISDVIHRPLQAELARQRIQNLVYKQDKNNELYDHDVLTGLYTETGFLTQVHKLLQAHKEKRFRMLCFDIEKFRLVNDLFGQEEGDRLLQYLGGKFVLWLQHHGGIGGRFGADRFMLCIPEPSETLEKIQGEVYGWIRAYPLDFKLSFPFGSYRIIDHTIPVNQMCDRAVMALSTIKGNYLLHYASYEESMRERLIARQEVLNDMETALRENQFEVYFQPVYGLRSGRLAGAEALVRWNHPQKGVLTPAEFLPIFEENGFIVKVDQYVRRQVCMNLQSWQKRGMAPLSAAVNLSRVTARDSGLVMELNRLLEEYGLLPGMLHLEVTESIFSEEEPLKQNFEKLRANGFLIMMDDFGSGYSTLNLLKNFEVDTLKLDMRFLEDYEENQRSRDIISAIIGLAKTLGMYTVMEGVESAAQVEFLRHAGCDFGQGYYFAKPMPREEYEKLLEKENA
ncbi:MAG: EAL domain-containing protein [Christensenella sp.]|nr:EAL domain-containing protein [Christensenella sp.]